MIETTSTRPDFGKLRWHVERDVKDLEGCCLLIRWYEGGIVAELVDYEAGIALGSLEVAEPFPHQP